MDTDELEVSITPDFHKGSGIPIGTTFKSSQFIVPAAIGNDINCGMRFYTTNLNPDDIRRKINIIEKNVRHIFFEGGRHIPMSKRQREALLKEGLIGLFETSSNVRDKGLWQYYDRNQQERDLNYVDKMGSYITDKAIGFDSFMGKNEISYDDQIGSIGGGNHFVEVQRVSKIFNPAIAKLWGVKENQVMFMLHTGSVSVGHHSGMYIRDIVKNIYPKSIKQPENNVYFILYTEKFQEQWEKVVSLLYNAANFAFANRLFLGLMLYKSISYVLGDFQCDLLYDSPHNFVWEEEVDRKKVFIHRKGSCTAKSAEQMQNTPFATTGQPVVIPGSMGAKSYLLAGLGSRNSLFSASHGAGRSKSRGDALKVDDKLFREFMEKFKVITPIDPNRPDIKGRIDILSKWEEELKKEAPFAYKDISPIIQTHVDNQLANVVAEMEPIFTIKG